MRDGGAILTLSSGGHPLPIVLRADGRVEQVGVPGSLVGVFEEVDVHDQETELRVGDTLVLYTDGLVDARQDDAMDDAALWALIESCSGFDAQQTADRLGDEVADPRGEAPDDSAVLVLRVRP
jgi:serine phosphatase RsbU (regulator of sigma subunit)